MGDWAAAGGNGGGQLVVADLMEEAEDVVAALAAYCRGLLLYDVKIFVCRGNWQGCTSSHTLITLEVSRRTFGWGR